MIEALDRIFKHPKTEAEFTAQAEHSKHDASIGEVYFASREEFQEALRYAQSQFPWLSDEFINETLQHEEEHLEEARIRFGESGIYGYRLQAIRMNNGNLGIAGGFQVEVLGLNQSEVDKHRFSILNAPKKKSASDKRATRLDPNSDISNENGFK